MKILVETFLTATVFLAVTGFVSGAVVWGWSIYYVITFSWGG